MAWVNSNRLATTGGGGGGGTTYAWRTDTFEQAVSWVSGALSFVLTFAPADSDGVIANFQNGNLFKGVDYSITGTTITLLFDYDIDPDVAGVKFQFQYPYIP